MIEKAIRDLLVADATFNGYVDGRLRIGALGQDDGLPAATYQLISATRETHTLGQVSLAQSRIQLDCLASTYAVAKAMADAARMVLSAYVGTVAGVGIGNIVVDNEFGDFDVPEHGQSEPVVHRVIMDFLCWFREAVPA